MMRVRSLSISRALLPVLALLSLSVSSASAQSPLLRDFEEHFFVERLIQIERAYHQADEARRIAAHKALLEQRRWIGGGLRGFAPSTRLGARLRTAQGACGGR
jgi:hypothetical protein